MPRSTASRLLLCLCLGLLAAACTETTEPMDGSVLDAYVDPSTIAVRFDPDAEGFYRMPWPSDARLTPDGTPDLSDFPNRFRRLRPPIDEIEANVRGFSTMPVVYVGLRSAVGDASLVQGVEALAPDSPIQLLDLSEEGCGTRFPLEVAFAAEGDELRDDHVLQVANAIGTVLTPGRPYGLILLRRFGEPEGRTTPRPDAFDRALRDTSGGDPLSASLSALRRCLPDARVALDDVAVATVFTPQDPVAELRALRDFAMDPAQLATHPVQGWEQSEAWSRRRLSLVTHTGVVRMPIFQAGELPYEEGGQLVFDDAGQPMVQRWEPVEISVAAGILDEPWEGPRPVLVFMDGTGWRPWGQLTDNWIEEAMAAGYVVMSFMPQFHGGRAGFAGMTETATFNIQNPAAGRTNFRQQAVETSYFVRLIRERIAGLQGMPELDTDAIVYGGHSQGALVGSLVAAVEDQYRAYALNGLSSYLTLTILHRKDIVDFAALVSLIYGYDGALDRHSPLLQILQLGGDAVDPHNFVSRWHGWSARPGGNSVFVSNGLEDDTTTPRGMEHMTMAADLPPIAPPGWDVDPVGVWGGEPVALPISGNETAMSGDPLTLATYLDAEQGHFTIYRRPFVRELALRFWDTARQGVPELSSRSEYQCGDGADEDLDGVVDCDDPDCAETPPCVEGPCDDGVDEDGNGLIDCADPVCADARVCGEVECADGVDDDGDGAADCGDDDCAGRAPCAESRCADGLDDDGDGAIDCEDDECARRRECVEVYCANDEDDDGDGAIDCEDSDCRHSAGCPELRCGDGGDEDGDGLIDCADPDCREQPMCAVDRESACGDGADDDGDGATDCEDADCALIAACAGATCADGHLGSQVGVGLFSGTLEGRDNRFPPGDCLRLGAGGDAPDVSLAWTAPAAGEYVVSTVGSEVDTIVSVISAECDPVQELACDDDEAPLSSSELTVTVEAGQTVVIVIGAYEATADAGPVMLHVYPAP